jgi:D-tyrosyl-tRNA(Tyr) deacylase
MRAILQRVESSFVEVEGKKVGEIGRGVLVLLGVERGDGAADARALAAKLCGLRLFEDAEGKTNLGVAEAEAAFLVVSQFTLAASLRKGRRPSFDNAARPEDAEPLVELVMAELRRQGFRVEGGKFRAMMKVHLVNDGPLTFVLEVRQGKVV